MKPQNNSTERGSALGRAIAVLERIVTSKRPIGLAELASDIDLPKATIHRLLQQLCEQGFVLRAAQKDRYVVGPQMLQLSAHALASMNTHPPLRAQLDQLVTNTGETCNVGVLDQDQIVYIERVEGASPLQLQLRVGSRVPFHCTSIGKLLVAEQHKNVRSRILRSRAIESFTKSTLITPEELEAEFAAIRSQGYSFNNQEFVEGLTSIAVAIRDGQQKAVAGLAVHAPLHRMDRQKAISYLPILLEAAEGIAEQWALSDYVGTPANELRARAS